MPQKIAIALASDHAGLQLKAALAEELARLGYAAVELGPNSPQSVDYPDYADKLAAWVLAQENRKGILICGSGIGMSIAANRTPGIRAALCRSGLEARLARSHNDANVLCLGERLTGEAVARDALKEFLETPFEGGRHQGRVEKLG